jgi:hypothetical protein
VRKRLRRRVAADRSDELRELVATYDRDGIEAALYLVDPEIRWASPPDWMDQSRYDGHDGLRLLDCLWRENFDDYGVRLEQIRRVGDLYVLFLFQHGRIKSSGDPIEQEVGWVMKWGDNGLITEVWAYFSWDQTLEAAATLS